MKNEESEKLVNDVLCGDMEDKSKGEEAYNIREGKIVADKEANETSQELNKSGDVEYEQNLHKKCLSLLALASLCPHENARDGETVKPVERKKWIIGQSR